MGFPNLKPVRPRETTVPDTEYELAMRHAGPMLQLALMLAREAGLRRGTIARFSRSNCNFDRNEVFGRSKAYTSYTVPMTSRLRERLMWACAMAADADEPLLAQYNRNRRPPHYNSLDTELMRLRRRVEGLGHWGLHDLRRTAARALYSRCHDLRKVQSFLGHAAPQQTLWYLGNAGGQLTIDDMEERLG